MLSDIVVHLAYGSHFLQKAQVTLHENARRHTPNWTYIHENARRHTPNWT